VIAVLGLLVPALVGAAPATQPTAPAAPVTVAVLDFQSSIANAPDLGKQIHEALTALLADEPSIRLVERVTLYKTIAEHELNLTGMIDPQQATQVGKLVGAKLLVTGKAFVLDKQLLISAKIIGTETTLIDGVLVKGPREGEVAAMVIQLAEKLAEKIRVSGSKLVAAPADTADPLADYRKKLQGRKLPIVALDIKEEHIGRDRAIDPPADTELRRMLSHCGITVIDTSETTLDKAGVELVLKGEAFSEYAANVGNLASCSARVEIKLVRRSDGKTLLAERTVARAADLSEQIAGKTALEKAANAMGLKVLAVLSELTADAK
jgi:TolB-like protein